MDFSWTEEQLELKRSIVKFAQNELNDDVLENDEGSVFPRGKWRKCAEMGIQGLILPEAYGGSDLDYLTAILCVEGLGYGCRDNGLTFGLSTQIWTVQPALLEFGTEEQKDVYLPGMVSGDRIGGYAATEPDVGSDVFSMRTKAERTDGGYVINGTKTLISFAPILDFVIVFARSDPDMGNFGISAFLVDRDTPGFRSGSVFKKTGLRTVPLGELVFEDCFVPETRRLGGEGAGASIFNSSQEMERTGLLAGQIGAMERQLENTLRYTKERRQFGQPIARFQSVSNRIADMKLRLEAARLLAYRAAWLKTEGHPAMLDAALAKLQLAEAFVHSSLDAIRNFGGYGVTVEFEAERDLRDSLGGTLYGGTSDIQRSIVARLLED